MSDEKLVYELALARVSFNTIQTTLETIYASVKDAASDAGQRAAGAGIATHDLPDHVGDLLGISKSRAGVDGSVVELIIAISGSSMVKMVATDLWKKVLLPMLVAQFGSDAIVAKKKAQTPPDQADSDGN